MRQCACSRTRLPSASASGDSRNPLIGLGDLLVVQFDQVFKIVVAAMTDVDMNSSGELPFGHLPAGRLPSLPA